MSRPNPSPEALMEAAGVLRAVLELIDAGELDAGSPRAMSLRRRLEGAIIGAEQAAGLVQPRPERPKDS